MRVHGLRRGSKAKAAVQVACAPAPHLSFSFTTMAQSSTVLFPAEQ